MIAIFKSCVGTKLIAKWGDLMGKLTLQAVRSVVVHEDNGSTKVDLKHYLKIEKIPGGDITDSTVIPGVMINKDVTHAAMRRRIVKPRIILLDCNLEYKKPANLVIKLDKAPDFDQIMRDEEAQVKQMVMDIIKHKPDLVITEKGLSDEAQHWFLKHNVTCLRRLQGSHNIRVARACGATIVSNPADIKDSDVGTRCGLFEIRKIGDEYWSFITDCIEPKASTVLLRGASKDMLNEIERNLHDGMAVLKNVILDPSICPGGGASEMSIASKLSDTAKSIAGVEQYLYNAIAIGLEVIPRTLLQNCGADIVRALTNLRAKHTKGSKETSTWGVDGMTGQLVDMKTYGVWEPTAVKRQTIKTSIEAACLLLRIDDVLSGVGGKKQDQGGPPGMGGGMPPMDMEM